MATVEQHTYDFDVGSGTLTARRTKEEADDYRYFPEPDLVPVEPPADLVERLRGELPELPAERIARVARTLDHDRALVLVTGGLDALWEATVAAGADGVAASNVIANQLVASGADAGSRRRGGAGAARRGTGADSRGRRSPRRSPRSASGGSRPIRTSRRRPSRTRRALEPIVDAVLAANPAQVEQYRGGKDGLLGFFVGQVMKETKGQADPRRVNELVRAKLTA